VYEVSLALATTAQIPAQISAALDHLRTIYEPPNVSQKTVHNPVYVAVLDVLFDLSRNLHTQAVLKKVAETPFKIAPETSKWLKGLAYAAATGNPLRFAPWLLWPTKRSKRFSRAPHQNLPHTSLFEKPPCCHCSTQRHNTSAHKPGTCCAFHTARPGDRG
jgi:transposase